MKNILGLLNLLNSEDPIDNNTPTSSQICLAAECDSGDDRPVDGWISDVNMRIIAHKNAGWNFEQICCQMWNKVRVFFSETVKINHIKFNAWFKNKTTFVVAYFPWYFTRPPAWKPRTPAPIPPPPHTHPTPTHTPPHTHPTHLPPTPTHPPTPRKCN